MRLSEDDLVLYAVTECGLGEDLYEKVNLALEGGIDILQLREKNLPYNEFLARAKKVKKLCEKFSVPLIINDNVQVALNSNADGVHLGQEDGDIKKAREILGKEKIIGVSAHNVYEAKKAWADGADYLGSGAVFGTATKLDVTGLSLAELKNICESVKIPVVAIGGVSHKNVMKLKGTGVAGAAVVSAIFSKDDVLKATKDMKMLIKKALED